MRHGSHLIEI